MYIVTCGGAISAARSAAVSSARYMGVGTGSGMYSVPEGSASPIPLGVASDSAGIPT